MKTAMVSSTVRDLARHREVVERACKRQGIWPKVMEDLSASDAGAVEVSRRLVEESDLYIGVFGHRYGEVPPGHDKSITEMEYDWASERDLPCLVFLIHKDHQIGGEDFETGSGAEQLKLLKERIRPEHVVGFFKSPEDLGMLVIQSLGEFRESHGESAPRSHDVPVPPAPYIAHPYTLLQTSDVIGRRSELNLLTDWVARPDAEVYGARVLALVAVGGMGKSALAWKWFSDIAPHEMQTVAGRVWWSFYESDATFDQFVVRVLAYVSGSSLDEVRALPPLVQEQQLLQALNDRQFLVVLDGLERILMAYARLDAPQVVDVELDRDAATDGNAAGSRTAKLAQAAAGQHRLRQTIDPRAGAFLRKLVGVEASRVLVSTRLFPAELETATGAPVPGAWSETLEGLEDDDAIGLWREFGVTGSRDDLIRLFRTFDNYPLLIRALAGEVARYRPAPGDFDRWNEAHPEFDPYGLELVQARSHVLVFALRGLTEAHERLLHTIAAFRAPTTWETLSALLVGERGPFENDAELDAALTELEDRGLVGWDRHTNRYDEHPVVRGVAWHALEPRAKRDIYESLNRHFAAIPPPEEEETREGLSATLEHFYALVNLERWGDAWSLVEDRILDAAPNVGTWEDIREVVEALFDPRSGMPRVQGEEAEFADFVLGLTLQITGQPGRAIPLWRRLIAFARDQDGVRRAGLALLATFLCAVGKLSEADAAAKRALALSTAGDRDLARAISLGAFGLVRSLIGEHAQAETALREAASTAEGDDLPFILFPEALRARNADWAGDPLVFQEAVAAAEEQARTADDGGIVRSEASAIAGFAALKRGNLAEAEERLQAAIRRAREGRIVSAELPALLYAAELELARDNHDDAQNLLREVLDLADRGPYHLVRADAENLLARIRLARDDRESAVAHAVAAYRLAWCDGPPYAYAHGLSEAARTLLEAGEPLPDDLPPFDAGTAHENVEVQIAASERDALLERVEHHEPAVRRDSIRALARLPGDDVRAAVFSSLDDSDASVRRAVVQTLAELAPDPEIEEAVVTALADDEAGVRAAAAEAAAQFGGERVLAALASALADDQVAVRRNAARGLLLAANPSVGRAGYIAPPVEEAPPPRSLIAVLQRAGQRDEGEEQRARPALEPFRSRLDDADPYVRAFAVAGAALAVPHHRSRIAGAGAEAPSDNLVTEAFQSLRGVLDDPDPTVRAIAAAGLGHAAGSDSALAPLVDDDDAVVRAAAVAAFTDGVPAEAIGALIARVDDADADVRRAATEALGAGRVPEARAAIVHALDDADPGVRSAAAFGLGNLSDPSVVPALLDRLADADFMVAGAAQSALLRYADDPQFVGLMLGALASPSPDVRTKALRALGHAPATPVATIVQYLDDEDPTLSATAAQALGDLWADATDPDRVEAIRAALVGAAGHPNDATRAAVMTALGRVRDGDALDVLATHVTDGAENVRASAVRALSFAGDERSTRLVRAALHDAEPMVRITALEALVSARGGPREPLLTADLDGLPPYIDPALSIDAGLVGRAALRLGLAEDEVRRRYEELAKEIPLNLAWMRVEAQA